MHLAKRRRASGGGGRRQPAAAGVGERLAVDGGAAAAESTESTESAGGAGEGVGEVIEEGGAIIEIIADLAKQARTFVSGFGADESLQEDEVAAAGAAAAGRDLHAGPRRRHCVMALTRGVRPLRDE